jgi:hypothetical protein
MPVRRIASINAEREIKKRKFVSPCFHRTNAGWYTGCSAPSFMTEGRSGKESSLLSAFAAQQLHTVIRQSARSDDRSAAAA